MNDNADESACWVVTPPPAGMKNQAVALAQAVGLPYRDITVEPRRPWTWLPADRWPRPLLALGAERRLLQPPWPALLITCGRRAVPYSLLIRRASRGRTFTVHLQNPQIGRAGLARFNLVAAPLHDRLQGDNVVQTLGSLHRVSPDLLAQAAGHWAARLAGLPRPLVAVLIGGPNRYFDFDAATAARVGEQLAGLARSQGVGLAVTASRRTGAENIALIRKALAGIGHFFWDFQGDNPYHGLLGLADAIIVTGDSVNMVCEATATGKPVHVLHLPGRSRRFADFHRLMQERGYTRPFDCSLGQWQYAPPDDTGTVAARIRTALAARRIAPP